MQIHWSDAWVRGLQKTFQDSTVFSWVFFQQDFNSLSDGVKDQTCRVLTLPYTQSLPACVWTPAALSSAVYSVSSKSASDHANCASLAQLAATGCYGFGSMDKQNTSNESLDMNVSLVQTNRMKRGA